MRRLSPWIVSCLALSACVPAAQTTAGIPAAPPAAVEPGPGQATMTFRIAVPVAAERQVAYVSGGTVAVRILLGTTADGTPVYQGALGQPVAGQFGVYEITSVVPLGQRHFTVELYGDAEMTAPMLLATGQADQLIEKGKANRVALTLQGVPRSVKVVMTNPTAEPNVNTVTARVQAMDAKGYVITGTYATPVSLALQHTGAQLTAPADVIAETSTDTFRFTYTSGTLTDSWVTASAPGVDAAAVTRAPVIRPCATGLTLSVANVPKGVLVGEPVNGPITVTVRHSDGRVDSDATLTVDEVGAGTVSDVGGVPTLNVAATGVTYCTLRATAREKRYTGLDYSTTFKVAVASLTMTPATAGTMVPYQSVDFTGTFTHPDPSYGPLINYSWMAPYGRLHTPTLPTTRFEYNGRGLSKTFDATLIVDTGSDTTWTKKIPVTFTP